VKIWYQNRRAKERKARGSELAETKESNSGREGEFSPHEVELL